MSREVTLPDTSIAAGKLKTEESKQHDYDRIVFAISVLGASHYEEIADRLGWLDSGKVSRRLLEMCPPTELKPKGKNLVYNTGAKGITKRNRAAYLYDLVRNEEKSAKPEKMLTGASIADYSRKLVQKNLFDEGEDDERIEDRTTDEFKHYIADLRMDEKRDEKRI